MPGPNLRPAVLAARDKLRKGREKLRTLHASGAPGIQVSTYLTDLVDAICLDLYQTAWADLGGRERETHLALVAHGGYGRRDVAPFSDVDLMMLLDPGTETQVRPVAQRLTQDICDAGMMLGFSLRTPADACQLALTDATVFTSLAESRFLAGHEPLFTRFLERLRRVAARNSRSLIRSIEESRQEERHSYGETNFLLMPNIKRSLGGLRDIQLVRWIGFARYGNTSPEVLEGLEAISPEDRRRLRRAQEFLLRLRNELHFHAGRAQDVLDRQEQVRLAKMYGYKGDEGLLPVEQFMRDYFHHTSEVKHAMTHFLATATARVGVRSVFNSVMSHDVEGDFRVGPIYISATQRGLVKVRRDLVHVMRLMDLANLYDKMIEHRTWEAIREAVQQRATIELTREVAERFLSLISQPGRLGDLLRRLHELRVLEQIIPGMSHARCLLQFNEFHKYTVDEHSIRAVEEAVRFFDAPGPIGEAYRGLRNKRLLHLALLIHDMGKGNPEDHSEVGAQLAEETARRLGLSEREGEVLRFLVHRHLMMSDLAQFRDTQDPDVVVDFAVEVGSPEVLQMLYVLTAADWAAVGPGVLTDWKLDLLTQLYLRVNQTPRAVTDRRPRNAQSRRMVAEPAGRPAPRLFVRRHTTRDHRPIGASAAAVAAGGRSLGPVPAGSPGGRVHHRHLRRHHPRDFSSPDRRADQPAFGDFVRRDPYAGGRPGPGPFLRAGPRFRGPAAAQSNPGSLRETDRFAAQAHGSTAQIPVAVGNQRRGPRPQTASARVAGPDRQRDLRPIHDPGHLRPGPHGLAVHHHAAAVRPRPVRPQSPHRFAPGPGRGRFLRHRRQRAEDQRRANSDRHPRLVAEADRAVGAELICQPLDGVI